MITQETIKNIFIYENGNLIRKSKKNITSFAGWINTVSRGKKYIRLSINKKQLYLHQVIYLYFYGYIPKYIDHINGNSLDNRIENLRETNQSLNTANSMLSKANTSGYKGVVWRKDTNKWMAQITKNRKNYKLGCFNNIEDAVNAYKIASKEFFGEFARP